MIGEIDDAATGTAYLSINSLIGKTEKDAVLYRRLIDD